MPIWSCSGLIYARFVNFIVWNCMELYEKHFWCKEVNPGRLEIEII